MVGAAIAGATASLYGYLSQLPPEQRRAAIETMRMNYEQTRFDASPEVLLARETIEREGLKGEHAEQLLAFARDLAKRREV